MTPSLQEPTKDEVLRKMRHLDFVYTVDDTLYRPEPGVLNGRPSSFRLPFGRSRSV